MKPVVGRPYCGVSCIRRSRSAPRLFGAFWQLPLLSSCSFSRLLCFARGRKPPGGKDKNPALQTANQLDMYGYTADRNGGETYAISRAIGDVTAAIPWKVAVADKLSIGERARFGPPCEPVENDFRNPGSRVALDHMAGMEFVEVFKHLIVQNDIVLYAGVLV